MVFKNLQSWYLKIFLANLTRLCYSGLVNARNKRVGLATETHREDAPRLETRPSFRKAEVHLGAARLKTYLGNGCTERQSRARRLAAVIGRRVFVRAERPQFAEMSGGTAE
jgi:hypothetical protein